MLHIGVLVELDHLLDNLIIAAIEMAVVLVDLGIVACLLNDPSLLFGVQLTLELAIVFKDGTLVWIVVTVPDVIGTLRDFFGPANVIGDQGEAVRAKSLKLLSVEPPVLDGTVLPLLLACLVASLCTELEVIIEEVFSIEQLAAVPLGNIATAVRVDQCALFMELSLIKVSLVDDTIGEGELSEALVPALLHGALVLTSAPLRHFQKFRILILFSCIN